MTKVQLISIASLFAGGLVLASCAQADPTQAETDIAPERTKTVELGAPFTTIKPGAAVTFSHSEIGPLSADDTGAVTVTVHEGYPHGTLSLQANSVPGLEVFGAETSRRIDMSIGTTHTWRIDFAVAGDGVYHLPIMAVAAPDGGIVEHRAYSIRIEVGDWQAAEAQVQSAKPIDTMASGEPAILMQAEETIN